VIASRWRRKEPRHKAARSKTTSLKNEAVVPEYNFDLNPAIAPIAKKLAKLLVQLGAENHEMARQAILRTLKENGCSLPDLGGVVERAALLANAKPDPGGLTQEDGDQIFQEAYARGRQEAQGEQTNKPLTWREIVDTCCNNIDCLNEKDRAFIRSIRNRIVFDEDEPTEKQQKWLKDCYRKVHINGNLHGV
jgi:hypothetical protein